MTLRALILAALTALSPALAAAETSGLVRLDDRAALLGWEAVGRLDFARGGFCTGTLIALDLVLTAAHCVYGSDRATIVEPDQLTFRAGFKQGRAVAERKVARIAVPDAFVPDGLDTEGNARHDIALLQLEAPISSTDADPFVLHDGPSRGLAVSVLSYGQGRADVPSRQRSCSVLGRGNGLIGFDCEVTFGSSGSPVFVRTGQRVRILSVVSKLAMFDGRRMAIGMELPDLVAELKTRLRVDSRGPAPVLNRVAVGGTRSTAGAKFVKP